LGEPHGTAMACWLQGAEEAAAKAVACWMPVAEADVSGMRDTSDVVTVTFEDLTAGKDLKEEIRRAYGPGGVGLLLVSGVPGLAQAREALLPQARELALLPPDVLNQYENPETFYTVGWSRGQEKFKGKPDIAKGSFYANPLTDDPSGGDEEIKRKFPITSVGNVWPAELPNLESAFKEVSRLVYEVAKPIVQQVDMLVEEAWPGHGTALYDRTFLESQNVVSRLLHYYSVKEGEMDDGDWCGWHNDNSTITGLVPAMWLNEETGASEKPQPGAGLVVEGRNGEQVALKVPQDCLAFQIGESAQILSGGVVHATPHMVKGHLCVAGSAPVCRETLACFIQPHWEGMLSPPPGACHDDIFSGREESKVIPPLSERLSATPLTFGDFLHQSVKVYYSRNNNDES